MLFEDRLHIDTAATHAASVDAPAMGTERQGGVLVSATESPAVAGLALAAIGIWPEVYVAFAEDRERRGALIGRPFAAWAAPPSGRTGSGDFVSWPHGLGDWIEPPRRRSAPAWLQSLFGFPRRVVAHLRRTREFRRLRAAWDMVDDHTLEDIGLSRHALAQLNGGYHWR